MCPQTIRYRAAAMWKPSALIAAICAVSIVAFPENWRSTPWWQIAAIAGGLVFLALGPLAVRSRLALVLSPEGLTIRYLLHQRQIPWDAIERAGTTCRSIGDFIQFPEVVLTLRHAEVSQFRKGLRRFVGGDLTILAAYELPAEDIAALLEQWRCRYGGTARLR